MSPSRRALLGAPAVLVPTPSAAGAKQDQAVARGSTEDLVARSHEGHAALMRGDIDGYRARIAMSEDFSFFSPFGGEARRADAFTADRMGAMGRFFKNGAHESHVVEVYEAPDLVVIVLVERSSVEVGDVPMQDWWLRVTLVYKHDGRRWLLAHRHADPLHHGIEIAEAARLAAR